MNRFLVYTLLMFSFFACKNGNIIENPDYEVKDAGIFTISKIEKSDSVTKLWIQVNYSPGSWVRFREDQTFIRPTGSEVKFAATAIENGEFDKELYMSSSGDTLFILSFPPIDKGIKQIDFLHYGSTVWGISFDGRKLKTYDKQDKKNEKRLKELLVSDPRKASDPENAFISGGKARFAGYIKGYDPRLDISGIIYTENVFTNEDAPLAIRPDSTGWFQMEFDLSAPSFFYINFGEASFSPYFEPGITTALVLDREDCFFGDIFEKRGQDFRQSHFVGAIGRLNDEMYELNKIHLRQTFDEFTDYHLFKSFRDSARHSTMQLLDEKLKQKTYLPLSQQLAKHNIIVEHGYLMLDKIAFNRGGQKMVFDSTEYANRFDFMKEMPDEPLATVVQSFRSFINRYEFSSILGANYWLTSEFDDQFFEMGFAEKNPDLQYYKELIDDSKKYGDNVPEKIYRHIWATWDTIENKYPDIVARVSAYNCLKNWKLKAETPKTFGLQTGFFFQTALVRRIDGYINDMYLDKATARIFIDYIKSNLLTYPFLRDEAESLYIKNFGNTHFEIPEGEAYDLFCKIMEPYKGKIVMIDFWAVWCSPCLYGIEQFKLTREKYKDSEKIALVYICGESPKDRYEQEVLKHGLYNSVLLKDDEFNLMRQLFQFNGIPRYALIDRDGSIISNNFKCRHNIYDMNTQTTTVDLEKEIESILSKR